MGEEGAMKITAGATTLRRALFATLGVFAVALGIIGVFVPGLPTTEFIIAASYLFARSSPRLHGWLEGNPVFGPLLRRFRGMRWKPHRRKPLAARQPLILS
jgi:uncharacterized membrane protein YbaN (DUF454 family)